MTWLNRLVANTLPAVPKSIVRRVSARYIAGESLHEALATVKTLNREKMSATLDILGEFVATEAEARKTGKEYVQALQDIHEKKLVSNVSLKLTQLGLKLDLDLCHGITREIVERAHELDNFVRIDMEDSSCTEPTLEIYRRLHSRYPNHVGCVIQAYLKRSARDVEALVELGANVRLCKGIYIERPEIAFRDPRAVNKSYIKLLTRLLEGGCYTGIATHDEELVAAAKGIIRKLGLRTHDYEFQMLLGVQEGIRRSILEEGHRLRVYIPFGVYWYEYSLRRLKENPRIAGHVMKGLFNGRS
jgi:proline dehydrogenase